MNKIHLLLCLLCIVPVLVSGVSISEIIARLRQRAEEGPTQEEEKQGKRGKRGVEATFYKCYSGTGETDVSIAEECVYAHNYLRDLHGVPHVVWDAELAAQAQVHANNMATNNNMYHSAADGYGENVAYKGISVGPVLFSPAGMTAGWYNELTDYDFANGQSTNGKAIGHFTQVVWKNTQKIGCGLSKITTDDSWDKTYYCCQYLPAGNVIGAYVDNVPAPTSGVVAAISHETEVEVSGTCDYSNICYAYRNYCSMLSFCHQTCPE